MNHQPARIAPAPSRFHAASILLCIALLFVTAIAVIEPSVAAQDGTGAATPTPPTNCIQPRVTVAAGPERTEAPLVPSLAIGGTPAASPVASPVAPSTPRASLETDLTATVRVLANCINEQRPSDVVNLTGDTFRGQMLGVNEAIDGPTYTALAEAITPLPWGISTIEQIQGTGRGTAEATVSYTIANQLFTAVWKFTLTGSGEARKWVIDAEERLEPAIPRGATSIAVDMANNRYRVAPAEVPGPAVKLDGTNDDRTNHEMLVLKLANGARTDQLLTVPGPNLPDGFTFIGQLTVPARSTGTLVLVDLQPGTYTIVCLLPDEEGVPDLAGGMQTTFRVK